MSPSFVTGVSAPVAVATAGTTTTTAPPPATPGAAPVVAGSVAATPFRSVPIYNTRDVRLDARVYLTVEQRINSDADHRVLEEIDQKIASYASRGPGCLLYNYDMDGDRVITNQIWLDRDAYIEWLEYLAEERQQQLLARRASMLASDKRISITGLSRDDENIPACFKADFASASTTTAKNNLGFFRSV